MTDAQAIAHQQELDRQFELRGGVADVFRTAVCYVVATAVVVGGFVVFTHKPVPNTGLGEQCSTTQRLGLICK